MIIRSLAHHPACGACFAVAAVCQALLVCISPPGNGFAKTCFTHQLVTAHLFAPYWCSILTPARLSSPIQPIRTLLAAAALHPSEMAFLQPSDPILDYVIFLQWFDRQSKGTQKCFLTIDSVCDKSSGRSSSSSKVINYYYYYISTTGTCLFRFL